MIVENFQLRCIQIADVDTKHFVCYFTKWIDTVDREKKNGFEFGGEFFKNEPLEVAWLKPRLILFAASTGQAVYRLSKREYRTVYEHHQVLIALPNGAIERTGLVVNDPEKWALTIRDQVSLLLDKINQTYGEELLQIAFDHLVERMLQVKFKQEVLWNEVDIEAIQTLFNHLEKKVQVKS